MLTGPVFLVGRSDGYGMRAVIAWQEKTGTAFWHDGFECPVFTVALDFHKQLITGIETTQRTHEVGWRVNPGFTYLQNHVTGLQFKIIITLGLQDQHASIRLEILAQFGVNFCKPQTLRHW